MRAETDNEINVLYVAKIPSERYPELTGDSQQSINKKRGIVRSLRSNGHTVEILSPIVSQDNGLSFGFGHGGEFEGTSVAYPPFFGFRPKLSILISVLVSTLLGLKYLSSDIDAVLFFNYFPKNSLTGTLLSYVLRAELILEYEDGRFEHPSPVARRTERIMSRVIPIDGAILTTTNLIPHVPTDNVEIVRALATVFEPPETDFEPEQDETFTVMFSGGLQNERGVDMFADIAEAFPFDELDCRFLACGIGSDDRIKELSIRFEQLGDEATFLGTVQPFDKYLSLLSRAEVLVVLDDPSVTYRNYCFPNKLVEYATTDAVVLTSNNSDVDMLSPQPFIIVDDYSVSEFLETIIDVHRRYDEIQSTVREKEETWIENECTEEVVAERLVRVVSRARANH
jgi:glycosyltransferase involved in cell wall biosynthesis